MRRICQESRTILGLVPPVWGPPVHHVDRLSDEELRAIELDENTEREAPTNYEATEERLAGIRQVEAKLRPEEAVFLVLPVPKKGDPVKGKRCRSRNTIPASTAGIAPRLGFFSSGPAGFIDHPGRVLVVCLMPAG